MPDFRFLEKPDFHGVNEEEPSQIPGCLSRSNSKSAIVEWEQCELTLSVSVFTDTKMLFNHY
jgi:hypothetical protein